MRQQRFNLSGPLRRQPLKNVLEVGIRVMPVELGRLDQAGDRRGAFSGGQGSREEPILATCRPGPDLLLVVIDIDRQPGVAQVARQRRPAVQAVVHGLGRGAAVRHFGSVDQQPGGESVGAIPWPQDAGGQGGHIHATPESTGVR